MATQTIDRTQGGQGGGQAALQRARNVVGNPSSEQTANGLGWFSIGLGLAELLAPGAMARVTGTQQRHDGLMRLLGLREIAAGVLILSGARRAGCWSRVAGDAMDLMLLGNELGTPGSDKARALISAATVGGVAVLDTMTALELTRSHSGCYDVRLERSIIVNQAPEECYRFWRNFENLPQFMVHVKSVRPNGENRTHWVARGPAGIAVEWDAEITHERPNESISWRSLENADLDNSGTVRFEQAPGGRGTIVRVSMYYSPPALGAGTVIATLFGQSPEQALAKDLRRFKQVLETGEVVTTEGQPAGRNSGATWLDAIAR
jgi:uncharacterized membrane protein